MTYFRCLTQGEKIQMDHLRIWRGPTTRPMRYRQCDFDLQVDHALRARYNRFLKENKNPYHILFKGPHTVNAIVVFYMAWWSASSHSRTLRWLATKTTTHRVLPDLIVKIWRCCLSQKIVPRTLEVVHDLWRSVLSTTYRVGCEQ